MRIDVIFPCRITDDYRKRNFKYVREAYRNCLNEILRETDLKFNVEFTVADDSNAEGFNRGRAINEAIYHIYKYSYGPETTHYIFADIDMVPTKELLYKAIVASDTAPGFVVPFTRIQFLNEKGSELLRKNKASGLPWPPEYVEFDFQQRGTGSINVMRKEVFDRIGCFDEHFTTWGYEDSAFHITSEFLCGPTTWIEGTILHLWHPHTYRDGGPEQQKCLKYCQEMYDSVKTMDDMKRTLRQRSRTIFMKEDWGKDLGLYE